jgi:hypothetical protein
MMHGVLILPAIAWMLSFVGWSERRRLEVVLLAIAGYVLVSGIVTLANLE